MKTKKLNEKKPEIEEKFEFKLMSLKEFFYLSCIFFGTIMITKGLTMSKHIFE